jgi:hypothetical protein
MAIDTVQSPATTTPRRRRHFGVWLALVGLLVTVGLLAAACGGGPNDPRAATATTATTTSTTPAAPSGSASNPSEQTTQSEELQFAQCMRSHGVSDFPDPSGRGLLSDISAAGVNTQSPTYQQALQSCKKYSPEGHLTPAQSAAENAEGLLISQCMRSHGVPNFPDPSTGPADEQVINLHGLGIDPSSPTFQAASSACQKLFPGSK